MTEKSLIERAREYKARQDARETALSDIRRAAEKLGDRPTLPELAEMLRAVQAALKEVARNGR